jgi:hypothetical protein
VLDFDETPELRTMSKAAASVPGDKLAFYDKLIASVPAVERKGAAMPYTSVNGHMFSFLTKDGRLALRLPAEERDAFLKRYKTRLCEQHGRVMKEYVDVPDRLFKKTSELKPFFEVSAGYVRSLRPKPTTRKKKAAPKKKKK